MSLINRCFLKLRDGRTLGYTILGAASPAAAASPPAQAPPSQHAASVSAVASTAAANPTAASTTLIYHHGWPSSAQEASFTAAAAADLGIQVVAFDRPGVGGSSYHPGVLWWQFFLIETLCVFSAATNACARKRKAGRILVFLENLLN